MIAQVGAFKIRNDAAIQLGYSNYRYLTFGIGEDPNNNNGSWSIEHWNHGLNFWKPWNSWHSGNYKMFIHDAGFVGINMKPNEGYVQQVATGSFLWWSTYSTQSNFRLQVRGNTISHGNYVWSGQSMKKNINSLDHGLSSIMKMRPVSYHYDLTVSPGDSLPLSDSDPVKNATLQAEKNRSLPEATEPKHFGFIAEEIDTVFPNIVSQIQGIEGVNYTEIIPVLVKGIQEQQQIIESLKSEVNRLNDLVESINTDIINEKGITASLGQNTPNPFNATTSISYDIQSAFTEAQIVVYDFWGQQKDEYDIYSTGAGTYTLDASSLPAGTYHYVLIVDDYVVDSKLMLIIH
jgi:hypothetical protein